MDEKTNRPTIAVGLLVDFNCYAGMLSVAFTLTVSVSSSA
jgi:hypothetical protein